MKLVSYANRSGEFIAISAMSKPSTPMNWSCGEELNPQHAAYKAAALPIELPQQRLKTCRKVLEPARGARRLRRVLILHE